jgi:2-dehydro-3-deoxyphosphogluconate aldolase/(4S)-4-hydroxy-2-oxoglutarate aldolase
MNVHDKIAAVGILPVIAVPSPEAAVPLADALVQGGMCAVEITLRNPWALDAIAAIRAAQPQMVIGAGTILTERQVADAQAVGADFLVSPGLDPDIVHAAQAVGLPIVPGVTNPSEIIAAMKLGLRTLKFFPAEISGGVAALTLYHGPFPDVRFVPTGGMTFDNVGTYLAKPFVAACGGSWMAKTADVKAGEWAKITEGCRRSVEIARAARGGS